MLDRYSQKDETLKTLSVGDLVITKIKSDFYFPIRGIGYVKKIKNDDVWIELYEEYKKFIDKSELINDVYIKRKKNHIIKPLEIYFEQIAKRVAKKISQNESTPQKINYFKSKFFKEISSLKFIPAGRILYGAGGFNEVNLFNCFALPLIQDTREGVAKHRKWILDLMTKGGGVGTNGSTLRPSLCRIKKIGSQCLGSVSWLKDFATLSNTIKQVGSRRGAQMIMLADWHPDIIEFILSKMQNAYALKILIEKTKSKEIKRFAEYRLDRNPLNDIEKKVFEFAINNSKKLKLNKNEEEHIRYLLEKNGNLIVKETETFFGANISIIISDKFMNAVKKDEMWELRFPDVDNYSIEEMKYYDDYWHHCGDVHKWEKDHQKTVKTYLKIKAKELWELICFCATHSGEPGFFFIDKANIYSNTNSYGKKIIVANPCGEQPLPAFASCNIGSINLSKFIDKKEKKILWNELEKTIRIAIRFLDNVIDVSPHILNEIDEVVLSERRIGLGVMGLHDLLIWKGLVYGSSDSLKVVDKLFSFIAHIAYDESSNLAVEKGQFAYLKGSREKFVNSLFCKNLSNKLRDKILSQGIRNSHLLTIAPTGTTGTMLGVSTGLEPYFAFKYMRSGKLSNSITVEEQIVKEYRKQYNLKYDDSLPKVFINANNLNPSHHVNMQITIQKWIDSAISKTINMPKTCIESNVEDILMKLYDKNAKGGTIYVDGSRNRQVLIVKE